MDNVAVLETPDYMDDGVHFPDICQKLVAKALALRSSLHQSCNIHKFNGSRYDFLRVVHLA